MIRICIIGTGNMANLHYDCYQKMPDVKVTHFISRTKNIHRGIACNQLSQLHTISNEIDVIDICTPPAEHFHEAMIAIALRKHIIVEKPLATTSTEAKQIYEFAGHNNVHVYPCHPMIFSPAYRTLLDFKNPVSGIVIRADLNPSDQHYHTLSTFIQLYGVPSITYTQDANTITHCFYNGFKLTCKQYYTSKAESNFEIGFLQSPDNWCSYTPAPYTGVEPTMIQLVHFIDCAKTNIPTPFIAPQTIYETLDILEELKL